MQNTGFCFDSKGTKQDTSDARQIWSSEIPLPSLPSAAKEIKSGASGGRLDNSLVKNVNPISNQKKPDPSKISQEELPERFDVKDARPPINIVDSIKSSAFRKGTSLVLYLLLSSNFIFALLSL
ncbi:hypothetical protein RUM44_005557 [Polyplax serrata]|uniref:Uncharacterized protein n=1 Tax=Polyplax serrata TaxID=468196 RepID=A0ABR1ADQ6_POLSC